MMTHARLHTFTAGFALFILLIIALADSGAARPMFRLVAHVPGGDKIGHFVLIGGLTFLIVLSLPHARVRGLPLAALVLALLVTVEEFSQIALRYRGFSLIDLAADYAGMTVFGWLALRLAQSQSPSGKSSGRGNGILGADEVS